MNAEFAIIVTAYNRADALRKLLLSLDEVRSDLNISLIISIDNNGDFEVNKIANDFNWRLGEKKVIIHTQKLGLRNHFIWVGDQTERFKNVIFLEDDLIVSPELVNFSIDSVNYYHDEENVAGISLYNPMLCEFTGGKFYQNYDSFDIYFLQHPYWGNIWTRHKWDEFKSWLKSYELNQEILPQSVYNWKESSFKKVFIQYLIETDKYMVIPRISLLTNNGEIGLHNQYGFYQYQVVIMNERIDYRFCRLVDSKAVYDAFFEIKPEILKFYNNELKNYDFEVDLKGIRHNYTKDFVLTTRPNEGSIVSFSALMKPMENGVIYAAEGEGIFLCNSKYINISDKNNKKYDKELLVKDIDMNYVTDIRTSFRLLTKHVILKIRKVINGIRKTN